MRTKSAANPCRRGWWDSTDDSPIGFKLELRFDSQGVQCCMLLVSNGQQKVVQHAVLTSFMLEIRYSCE